MRAIAGKIDAPKLHNQVLACTSAIFSWAIRQEILTNNPCRGVERHAVTSRERVLSDQEVPLFWNAFADVGIAGLALKVMLLTGQRPGEIRHMRASTSRTTGGRCPVNLSLPCDGRGPRTHRLIASIYRAKARELIAELSDDDTTGFVFGTVPP